VKTAYRVAAILLVALGAGIRVVYWLKRPSLWEDEIKLSLNIGMRDFGELAGPLDHEQIAPVPYLWATKAATLVFGMNELALRLPALVVGVLLLVLVTRWAFRVLEPPAALVAVAMVVMSPLLVRYANEVKHYELEACVTVAVGLALAAHGSFGRALGVGTAGATLSVTAPFVLPVPVVLAAARGRRPWLGATLATVAWVTVFALVYVFVYRRVSALPYMRDYWRGATLVPGAGHARWSFRAVVGGIWQGTHLDKGGAQPWLAGGLLSVGAAALAVRLGLARAAPILAPLLFAAGAALAGAYPLVGRTMLFAAPLLAVIAAEALWFLAGPLGGARAAAVLVAGTGLLVPSALQSLAHIDSPAEPQAREAVAWLARRVKSGDTVYVSARAVEPWLYYTTDWDHPDRERYPWLTAVGSTRGPAHENAPSRGHAVTNEGDDLSTGWNGVHVLIGVASGMHADMPTGFRQRRPDPGFIDNEVRRLRDLSGKLWLLHYRDVEMAQRQIGQAIAPLGHLTDHFETETAEVSGWDLAR
jgi:hypothetical protein